VCVLEGLGGLCCVCVVVGCECVVVVVMEAYFSLYWNTGRSFRQDAAKAAMAGRGGNVEAWEGPRIMKALQGGKEVSSCGLYFCFSGVLCRVVLLWCVCVCVALPTRIIHMSITNTSAPITHNHTRAAYRRRRMRRRRRGWRRQ
jgi:hypothetical protein